MKLWYKFRLKTAIKALEEKLPKVKGIDPFLFFYIGKVYSYHNASIMENDLLELTELLTKSSSLNLAGKAKLTADFINTKSAFYTNSQEEMSKSLGNKPTPPKKKPEQKEDEEEKKLEGPKHTIQNNPYNNSVTPSQGDSFECVICLQQRPDSALTLDCKHKFHTKCIANFVEKRLHEGTPVVCPMCKVGIEYKEMMNILEKAGYVDNGNGNEESNTQNQVQQQEEGVFCKNCNKVHPPHQQQHQQMSQMDALMSMFARMGVPIQIIQPNQLAQASQSTQIEGSQDSPKRARLWECPQCDTVGPIDEEKLRFECKKCGVAQCLKCKNEWHEGFTCEELMAILGES